jgi:hypothetical protein
MALTRHLYEMDEVVSALQVCLRTNSCRALFWIWELVQSEEASLAFQTINDAWLLWGGGYDTFSMSLGKPTDPTDPGPWIIHMMRVQRAIQMAGRRNALRFLNEVAAMPGRPNLTPPAATAARQARRTKGAAAFVASLDPAETLDRNEAASFWISLDSACRQKSVVDALWLLQAATPILSADAIWSAICIATRSSLSLAPGTPLSVLQTAATPHPESQLLHQAAAILLLSSSDRDTMIEAPLCSTRPPPPVFVKDWETWTMDVGRRAARRYAIPDAALHSKTARGQITAAYTNIADIREPVSALPVGCAWWRRVCAEVGLTSDPLSGACYFPNDDVLESFYDRFFPDDIPDEWSAADQCKSHGPGHGFLESQQQSQQQSQSQPPSVVIRDEPAGRRHWNYSIRVPL